jgi:hypothetical protein
MEIAYKGTTNDVQGKLRRVFNVWRERSVFEPVVLGEIDRRLDGSLPPPFTSPVLERKLLIFVGVDKAKGKGGIIRPGKSTSPAIPAELVPPPPPLNSIDGDRTH